MTRPQLQFIPKNVNRIQFNCCYNPSCKYYLVAPSTLQNIKGFKVNSVGAGSAALKCAGCGRNITLKSNQAIELEYERLSKPSSTLNHPVHVDACHNEECDNYNKKASYHPKLYKFNGKTKTGNQRYVCKLCLKSFTHITIKEKRKPNARVDIEKLLFKEMVNKTPVRGSLDVFEISPKTYYDKLDRFADKCALFSYKKEKRLRELTKGKSYNLCTDKQDYTLNWTNRKQRVNTVLHAVGTADLKSGYVFGMHLNFDPSVDISSISKLEESTSAKYPQHHRKYAHLWMPRDTIIGGKSPKHFRELQKELTKLNLTGAERSIVENDRIEELNNEIGTIIDDAKDGWADSIRGARIHSEYTMFAHFLWLAQSFFNAKKVNFYLDQESGIDRAVLNSFGKSTYKGKFDAFLISIDKGQYTVSQKETMKNASDFDLHELMDKHSISYYEAQKMMLCKALIKKEFINNKEWLRFPYADMKEPEKLVHWITSKNIPLEEQADLYHPASLHAIDRFFMIARRKISTLERPISSQGSVGKKWNSTSSYSPEAVEKRLIMLRTYRNYVFVGDDGKTPAMRFGLADKPYDVSQIIHR